MYELLTLFFDICLLKKGPQDIPFSKWLFHFLIILYTSISFINLYLSGDPFLSSVQVTVDLMLILSITWVILFVANKLARYQQTMNALLATATIISFFSLPAMATLIGQGNVLSLVAMIFFMLWHWVISGHIFSQSLEQPFLFGLGVAFLYILSSFQVMALLFPEVDLGTRI